MKIPPQDNSPRLVRAALPLTEGRPGARSAATTPRTHMPPRRDPRPSERRGFTMVEVSLTLVILVIIAGLAFSTLHQIKTRNTFSASAAGLLTSIRKVRADAFGSGGTSVFVVNQNTGQYWGIEDVAGTFSLSTFSSATPAPAPAKLLLSGKLPTPVAFGPATGYGRAFPQPYAWVHSTSTCTFCLTSGTNSGYGSISFLGGGGVVFSGVNPIDGSFSIQSPNDKSTGGYTFTSFAIIGRTGAVENFDGTHS